MTWDPIHQSLALPCLGKYRVGASMHSCSLSHKHAHLFILRLNCEHVHTQTHTYLLTNAHCHTFTHQFTLTIHMSPYTQSHLIPTFTLTYVDTINKHHMHIRTHTHELILKHTHSIPSTHMFIHSKKIIPIHTAKGLPIEMWYKPTFPQMFPLALPSSILSHFQSSCSEALATDIQTHSYDSVTSQSSDLGRNHPGHGFTCRIHKHTQHTALSVPNPLQGVNDRPSSRSEINLKPQVKTGDRVQCAEANADRIPVIMSAGGPQE